MEHVEHEVRGRHLVDEVLRRRHDVHPLLQALERRHAAVVERDDLAVEDHIVGTERVAEAAQLGPRAGDVTQVARLERQLLLVPVGDERLGGHGSGIIQDRSAFLIQGEESRLEFILGLGPAAWSERLRRSRRTVSARDRPALAVRAAHLQVRAIRRWPGRRRAG